MYHHLLLPTDGSPLSNDAVRRGVQFAHQLGARVTGFYAMPEFQMVSYTMAMEDNSKDLFDQQAHARAEQVLAVVQQHAAELGVECDTVTVSSDMPYEAIIRTATEHGCDLIMMASHGRRGLQGLLLGSETSKVLTHSKIAVLVQR